MTKFAVTAFIVQSASKCRVSQMVLNWKWEGEN